MKRFLELDFLRGFLLLMMIVNHSPSPLRRFTDQPLGFFSTAEGFVFVSALLAGMLFQRRSEKMGFAAAKSATVTRAFKIYLAHLGTLVFAFLVGGLFLVQLPGLRNLLNEYWKNPAAAAMASLALIFQPPLMDILPMYIVFSFLTPIVFWTARCQGWRLVFVASAACWGLSQFQVRDTLLAHAKVFSFVDPGPFDLLSWQFLWVGGLIFGKCVQQKRAVRMPVAGELTFLVLGIAFLVWRWACIYFNVDPSKEYWFLNKWHLGPLRVLNFFAVAWMVSKVLPRVVRWERLIRPLTLVGQNMLPVFVFQLCLSLLLLGFLTPAGPGPRTTTFWVLLQMASALGSAWMLDHWARGRAEVRNGSGGVLPAH
jgi:hypothetical protein